MKMKKIIAPTMTQAMKKVKEELGEDAVIFHTKKIVNGHFFNLFKKESVEVLAASDPEPPTGLNSLPENPDKKYEQRPRSLDLQGMPFRPAYGKVDRLFSGPEYIEKLRDLLIEQGIRPVYTDELLRALVKKWYQSDEKMSEGELRGMLKAQLIRKMDPRRFQSSVPSDRFIMLVGPTGVGKTTTIAKMAGRAVLNNGERIAFITSDTFRIAAINQLKMYADILHAAIEVSYTPADFQALIDKYSDYDRVFIDTAGRNYKDEKYVLEIEKLLAANAQIKPFLVLSATSKYEDMCEIVGHFERLPADRLIITKIDETATYGAVISTLLDHPEKRITYITNGQEVPDDLYVPNLHGLINRLLGDEK